MRDTLALLAAIVLGVALGALPFLHYRLGGAHHGSPADGAAHAHATHAHADH